MPKVTKLLILTNIAVFILQGFFDDKLTAIFALWPIGHFAIPELNTTVGFQIWQLVTAAFLHASVLHIGLNMYALYLFGRDVEKTLGSKYYLGLYSTAVLSAACVQLLVVSLTANSGVYPTVGASGGIFGILLAYGVLFPRRILLLIFPPIPIPAWLFVILYGLIELANGVLGTEAGVAHFAHLGGMLGGYLVLKHWRRRQVRINNIYTL
jgi:membrane associated rhomboid family serine protease